MISSATDNQLLAGWVVVDMEDGDMKSPMNNNNCNTSSPLAELPVETNAEPSANPSAETSAETNVVGSTAASSERPSAELIAELQAKPNAEPPPETPPGPPPEPSAVFSPPKPVPGSGDDADRDLNVGNHKSLTTERDHSESSKSPQLPINTPISARGTHNLAQVLHSLQCAHQRVMEQTLELDHVRAHLATEMTTFVQSLDQFMSGLTSFIDKTPLSDDLFKQFVQLSNDEFKTVRNDQFAVFQTANHEYEQSQNALVQALWRPGRYLDKLLEGHKNEPTGQDLPLTLSSSSSQDRDGVVPEDTQYSPELLQYLSQTGDVDTIHEKLVDLNFEHSQILSDKETREQYGLSLDEDSLAFLESFDMHNQALLAEFDAAKATLDSLRQYLTDEETYMLSAKEPSLLDDDGELTADHGTNPGPVYPQLQQDFIKAWASLDQTRPTPIDPTDFINTWLLNELQSSSSRWRTFSSYLEEIAVPQMDAQQLDQFIRTTWFNDISLTERAQRRRFADQQSMEQNQADSQHPLGRSATVAVNQPISAPLLKLDSTITANDIIERVRQTRELQYYSEQQQAISGSKDEARR